MSLPPCCSVCPNKSTPQWIVRGEGSLRARIAMIGERPGIDEHFQHRPFVGKTGDEVCLHLLPLCAGLQREDVYIDNVNRCWRGGDNPEPYEVMGCSSYHLPSELSRRPIEIVCLMGAAACQIFEPLPGDDKIRLDMDHGIPRRGMIFGKEYLVLPMYHPASGLHKSMSFRQIIEDFQALKLVAGGRWRELVPEDKYPGPFYRLWEDSGGEQIYRLMGGEYQYVSVDTETVSGRPFCMTYSCEPGTGFLIRAEDMDGLDFFRRGLWVHLAKGGRVLMHNSLYDLEKLRMMGVEIPHESVIDTMQIAYTLQLPQALKVLSYRLAGMRMKEYEDLVDPYVESAMWDYLSDAVPKLEARAEELRPPLVVTAKGRKHRDPAFFKRVDRIRKDFLKGGKVNLMERFGKLPENIQAAMVESCGPAPKDSIALVPLEEIVPYACADADAPLRLLPILEELRDRMTEAVEERDYDRWEPSATTPQPQPPA